MWRRCCSRHQKVLRGEVPQIQYMEQFPDVLVPRMVEVPRVRKVHGPVGGSKVLHMDEIVDVSVRWIAEILLAFRRRPTVKVPRAQTV